MILGEGNLGATIMQWRTNLGLTAVKCAERAGITDQTWRRIESGAITSPRVDTVFKMFTAMGAQVRIEFAPQEHAWIEESREASGDPDETAPHLGAVSP